jgi:hypothetical protein
MTRSLGALAGLAACLCAAPGSAQTVLAWKMAPGESFFAERQQTRKESAEVAGKVLDQHSVHTWLLRFDVKESGRAGYAIAVTLERVEHKVSGAVMAGGLDDKVVDRMRGRAFSLTVTPQGKITAMAGYSEFVEAVADKQADRAKLLRATWPEDGIRQVFGDVFACLPGEPVNPGHSWKRQTVEPVPLLGAFESLYQYQAEGGSGTEQRVGFTITAKYQRPEVSDGPIRVVKGEMRLESGKGCFRFDPQRGRLLSLERSTTVRGNLVLESADRQSTVAFTIDEVVRVRTYDKAPP